MTSDIVKKHGRKRPMHRYWLMLPEPSSSVNLLFQQPQITRGSSTEITKVASQVYGQGRSWLHNYLCFFQLIPFPSPNISANEIFARKYQTNSLSLSKYIFQAPNRREDPIVRIFLLHITERSHHKDSNVTKALLLKISLKKSPHTLYNQRKIQRVLKRCASSIKMLSFWERMV